jgi:hypothetical protein
VGKIFSERKIFFDAMSQNARFEYMEVESDCILSARGSSTGVRAFPGGFGAYAGVEQLAQVQRW